MFPTRQTGSRIVATLCFSEKDGYTIFQSTIPRGQWREHIEKKGGTAAPTWYAAAHAKPPPDEKPFNPLPHSEDSAEFMCE
jgi:hypothetical protein